MVAAELAKARRGSPEDGPRGRPEDEPKLVWYSLGHTSAIGEQRARVHLFGSGP